MLIVGVNFSVVQALPSLHTTVYGTALFSIPQFMQILGMLMPAGSWLASIVQPFYLAERASTQPGFTGPIPEPYPSVPALFV